MAILSGSITRSSSISSVNLTSLGGDDYLVGNGDNLSYNYKSGGTLIGTPTANWSFTDANQTPTGYSVSGTDGDPTSSFTITTLYGGFTDSGQTWEVVISGVGTATRNLILFWSNGFADASVTATLSDASVSPLTLWRDDGAGSGDYFTYELEFAAGSAGQTLTLEVLTEGPNCFIGWLWVSSEESSGVTHTTTGALSGQGSSVSGTATNFTVHTTTGALSGQGSDIDGTSSHLVLHTSSGSLVGQGSDIDGTAFHSVLHATSGTLSGQGSSIVGEARNFTVHPSSGVLIGQGSEIVGESVHTTTGEFISSGDLVGQGSQIVGVAEHISNQPAVVIRGGDDYPREDRNIKPKKEIRELIEKAYNATKSQIDVIPSTKEKKQLKREIVAQVNLQVQNTPEQVINYDLVLSLVESYERQAVKRYQDELGAIILLLE